MDGVHSALASAGVVMRAADGVNSKGRVSAGGSDGLYPAVVAVGVGTEYGVGIQRKRTQSGYGVRSIGVKNHCIVLIFYRKTGMAPVFDIQRFHVHIASLVVDFIIISVMSKCKCVVMPIFDDTVY